jgi:hypothetical protein
MAYVVARKDGRFEIRECRQTAKGPRARTLASFRVLDAAVLAAAATRATRPFPSGSVLDSGRRAGAQIDPGLSGATGPTQADAAFVAASRRMAELTGKPASKQMRADPGHALSQLLDFADAIAASQPPRAAEPLAFPVLSHLVDTKSRSDREFAFAEHHR